jgi:hypothetical protein
LARKRSAGKDLTVRDIADAIEEIGGPIKRKVRSEIDAATRQELNDFSEHLALEAIESMKVRKTDADDAEAVGNKGEHEPQAEKFASTSDDLHPTDPMLTQTQSVQDLVERDLPEAKAKAWLDVSETQAEIDAEVAGGNEPGQVKKLKAELKELNKDLAEVEAEGAKADKFDKADKDLETPLKIKNEDGIVEEFTFLDCLVQAQAGPPKPKAPPVKAGAARGAARTNNRPTDPEPVPLPPKKTRPKKELTDKQKAAAARRAERAQVHRPLPKPETMEELKARLAEGDTPAAETPETPKAPAEAPKRPLTHGQKMKLLNEQEAAKEGRTIDKGGQTDIPTTAETAEVVTETTAKKSVDDAVANPGKPVDSPLKAEPAKKTAEEKRRERKAKAVIAQIKREDKK